jgi:hypothetical protein
VIRWLRKMREPKMGYCNWEVINAYETAEFRDRQRFGSSISIHETEGTIMTFGQTKFKAMDDVPIDRLIVPDWANMFQAETGGMHNLNDEGWIRIPGRPFFEYVMAYYGAMGAKDCRYMGQYTDLNPAIFGTT